MRTHYTSGQGHHFIILHGMQKKNNHYPTIIGSDRKAGTLRIKNYYERL